MERLQKVMARAGIASRRRCEEMISAGIVKVNGKVVTELGTKVDPGRDKIIVAGKPLFLSSRKRYILMYKPRGLRPVRGSRPGGHRRKKRSCGH
jgi:16S rRNA U516 pseudouridylate synthase RsuA-like enzyme